MCCGDTEERDHVIHVQCSDCAEFCHFVCLKEMGIPREKALEKDWLCPICKVVDVTKDKKKFLNFPNQK